MRWQATASAHPASIARHVTVHAPASDSAEHEPASAVYEIDASVLSQCTASSIAACASSTPGAVGTAVGATGAGVDGGPDIGSLSTGGDEGAVGRATPPPKQLLKNHSRSLGVQFRELRNSSHRFNDGAGVEAGAVVAGTGDAWLRAGLGGWAAPSTEDDGVRTGEGRAATSGVRLVS